MTFFDISLIVFIFTFFFFVFLWINFNSFIVKKNQVKEDFSDIDIQLKRKMNLIEQLINIVKAYAKHEKEVFENVARVRSYLDKSTTITDIEKAENLLNASMRSIFAIVENYPDLKANESYQNLMLNLKETEDRIAFYREEYNKSVKKYNNAIQVFPSHVAAKIFGFNEENFFQLRQ